MLLWRVFSLALVALSVTFNSTATAQCTQARVRRAWTALSPADRQLYTEAVGLSMDSGAYIKFIEIHTEMMSEMEAHRQCMFIYWHRLLLVAFENMLRGQGAKYACVTVPYWDWITDYNKFMSGQCRNILACSPALSFLGGPAPTSQARRTITINNEAAIGFCEADPPMNRFCQSSTVSGTRCARCVPRNDWSRVSFPASASFASVRAQLFGAADIGAMSNAIERGVHNNLHAALGSTMATFASPADPIFWSHHAMVDLLHSVFHKCKVGESRLTMEQKIRSADWRSCERRNGGVFNPRDYVTMRTGFQGRNPLNATRDRTVGRFFTGVPLQFAALMDTGDLGTSSYSYALEGLLGTLYTQCGNTTATNTTNTNSTNSPTTNSTNSPTANTPPTNSTNSPTANTPPTNSTNSPTANTPITNSTNTPTSNTPTTNSPTTNTTNTNTTTTNTPTTNTTNTNTPATNTPTTNTTRRLDQTQQAPRPTTAPTPTVPPLCATIVNKTADAATVKVAAWVNATDKLVKRRGGNAVLEAEKMACLFQDECLGGVASYTAEFKLKFGLTEEPRCKRIVDRINRRGDSVKVTEWKAQMIKTFGCPQPKNAPPPPPATTTATPTAGASNYH